LFKIGKFNSAYSKIKKYSSKFSFLPCKKKIEKKNFLKVSVFKEGILNAKLDPPPPARHGNEP
jgi:hypothetical protein